MSDEMNDNHHMNDKPLGTTPDAYGQAALLLSESTLHALVEKGLLSAADALDITVFPHFERIRDNLCAAFLRWPCVRAARGMRVDLIRRTIFNVYSTSIRLPSR